MEASVKKFTVESLAELIRQDPDQAFDMINQMPEGEAKKLLSELPDDEFDEVYGRAILANLEANIKNEVETP